ncbi:DUF397 domain-containing protein [Streptomyces sp. NPDC006356]
MVNDLKWFKSSRTGAGGEQNCVEIARLEDGGMAVRDSKTPHRARLLFTANAWHTFTTTLRGSDEEGQ